MRKSRRDGGPIFIGYLTGIKFKMWETLRLRVKRSSVILLVEFRGMKFERLLKGQDRKRQWNRRVYQLKFRSI
jgi:hypothetical protein